MIETVKKTKAGNYEVSTIITPDYMFETLVFRGADGDAVEGSRYASHAAAMKGHAEFVAKWRNRD